MRRTRSRIAGSAARPRLAVFRSNKAVYVQLIDDKTGRTLASASNRDIGPAGKKMTKTEIAAKVGETIAKQAIAKGVKAVVFDRRSYRYHGRVKALADGARKGGLTF